MAWSLAAIEFVAWSVLQEDGSGEEVADKALEQACLANPFVAWHIAHREIFDEVNWTAVVAGDRAERGVFFTLPIHGNVHGQGVLTSEAPSKPGR